jgi:hypothetical protein
MHIGEKIEARAKELGVGATALARKIGTSKQNVYGIYQRSSIDTDLLVKLGKALEFDFFVYYSSSGNSRFTDDYRGSVEAVQEEILRLKQDLQGLRERHELLRALYETKTGEKVPGTRNEIITG